MSFPSLNVSAMEQVFNEAANLLLIMNINNYISANIIIVDIFNKYYYLYIIFSTNIVILYDT